MNFDAIDAGVSAIVKIDVPESWKNAQDIDKKMFTLVI